MKMKFEKYTDSDDYYGVNEADYDASLNSLAGAPPIMQELRQGTIDILLRQASNEGQSVVKVTSGLVAVRPQVKGYATFLSQVKGSNLAELEQKLGFKAGVLQVNGAYIYTVNPLALNPGNIAPRGNTDWSAGLSPRDLHNLSNVAGVTVGNHRDYPAATKPILQFTILEPVPYLGGPRFLTGMAVV
jgi:hypothetical protein